MYGDFSRDTFDPINGFLRVLYQQGRASLDADPNEQTAIFVFLLQKLTADLIGPHGGPSKNCGFGISITNDMIHGGTLNNFAISAGCYYVDGILCENLDKVRTYVPNPSGETLPATPFMAYLDVWERSITSFEDDRIREVALGGPDTAMRTKVVWQVNILDQKQLQNKIDRLNTELQDLSKSKKDAQQQLEVQRVTDLVKQVIDLKNDLAKAPADSAGYDCKRILDQARAQGYATLKARTRPGEITDDPCILPPDSRYRGLENQLYRVEIHTSGYADKATFKFSRENGSVYFPIRTMDVNSLKLTLADLGRDARRSLEVGDWVEVVDDNYILQDKGGRPLLKVSAVDPLDMTVSLETKADKTALVSYDGKLNNHALLRRWDQREGGTEGLKLNQDGTITVREGTTERDWIMLEDGVQILFPPVDSDKKLPYGRNYFRAGDYWLIPARTVTGDVEWPRTGNEPDALPPRHNEHHYAPLAIVKAIVIDSKDNIQDCRCQFQTLCEITDKTKKPT